MFCRAPVLVLVVLAAFPVSVRAQSTADVQVANDRVTVRAAHVPLRDVVEEVARKTGIKVDGSDRLRGDCSIEFRDQYYLDALNQLLADVNFLVSKDEGVLHVHIHSMSSESPQPVTAAAGPIVIEGLSDAPPPVEPPGPPEEEDDEEQAQLQNLRQKIAGNAGAAASGSIIAATKSEFPSVRIAALQAITDRNREMAVGLLAVALGDEDEGVAQSAADLLARIPGPAALDALNTALANGEDIDAKFAALRGLALRADPAAIPALKRATSDEEETIRKFAVAVLQELGKRQQARTETKAPPR